MLIKKSEALIEDMSYMLCNCKSKSIKIKEISGREIVLKNVTNISNMFKNCSYLKEINLQFFYFFDKLKSIDSLFSGCEEITNILKIVCLKTDYVTKMDRIFNFCKKLNNVNGIEKFNTE